MKTQRYVALALAISMLGNVHANAQDKASPDNASDAVSDTVSEKLQGRWRIVSGVNQGRELTDAEVEGTYVTVLNNTIVTYDRHEQQRYRAIFRVDDSKTPIQLTMSTVVANASSEGLKTNLPPGESEALGILKFRNNEEWTICYGLPGAERPSKFESPKESKIMLFTLKKDLGDPVPEVTVPK